MLLVASLLLPLAIIFRFGEHSEIALIALVSLAFCWLVYSMKWTVYLFQITLVFLLFSVETPLFGGSALSLPAEPLAILLACISVITLVFSPGRFVPFLKEPVFWAALFIGFSLILSTLFSSSFAVSAKYVFIVSVFALIGVILIPLISKDYDFDIKNALRHLAVPIILLCLYAFFEWSKFNFRLGTTTVMAQPFFKDHTVLGATFSLFLPLYLLWPSFRENPKKQDLLFTALGLLVLFMLFISTSRASWLAVLAAVAFYVFIKLGGTLKTLSLVVAFFGLILIFKADSIKRKLAFNTSNSTEANDGVTQQALSVVNVNSDVSNLERLNRWKCAWRMGMDKPLVGFGPGTYQFEYFPYQRDEDKTYISVDSPFNTMLGRGGSAHSEYLLLLSESGIPGLLSWLALQVALLFSFFKIWQGNLKNTEKNLALAIYLGTLTYTVHSLFNNFLNNVQFGLIWWILVGALLTLSIKNKQLANVS